MSASLVGSEMCIRDSCRPPRTLRLPEGGLRPRTPQKAPPRARQPVSSSPSESARKMTPNPPDEALE
eukprot:2867354-Alexandrium_andersonii.AAC.1